MINLVKPVGETRKFLVGWGHHKDRMAFFISHKELEGTLENPIVVDPEHVGEKLIELAKKVDQSRRR